MARAEAQKSWAKEIGITVTGSVIVLFLQNHLGLSSKSASTPPAPPAAAVAPAAQAAAVHFLERGKECARARQHDKAVEHYTEALRLDPGSADGRVLRGWAYLCLGHLDLAVADYSAALRLDPTLSRAYANRGWAYAQLRQYEQAVQDCDAALRFEPHLEQARRLRTWAAAQLGAVAARPN